MNRNDFIERTANLATALVKLPEDAEIISAEVSNSVGDSIHVEYKTFCKYLQGKSVIRKTGVSSHFFTFKDDLNIKIISCASRDGAAKEKCEIVLPMLD